MTAIGVLDIGGTSIKPGWYSEVKGLIALARVRTPTDSANGSPAERLTESLREAIDVIKTHEAFDVLGVASPGPFTTSRERPELSPFGHAIQILQKADNPTDFPLFDVLFQLANVPVIIANDAVANLKAEQRFGEGRRIANLALLIFGTGIGYVACEGNVMCVDGFGNGPEPAETWIEELGMTFEYATGGPGLAKRFGRDPSAGDVEMATFAATVHGSVIAPLLARTHAKRLVTTGGVADRLGDFYTDALKQSLAQYMDVVPDVRQSRLHGDVGLLGAACVAMDAEYSA